MFRYSYVSIIHIILLGFFIHIFLLVLLNCLPIAHSVSGMGHHFQARGSKDCLFLVPSGKRLQFANWKTTILLITVNQLFQWPLISNDWHHLEIGL